ncbi:uncharacterized protein LOC115761037 isoform X2 [Drosophila novamexicana]|uniref:uncharacterized protein LOC115761037 isoform X2 n=1 Tax=Drosophila novamexicana TaxID=47314 RepID=UPI0011E5F130|nr:uncharacterized protein LOC115761037 isoform X2 [Drosophila novamexicana]
MGTHFCSDCRRLAHEQPVQDGFKHFTPPLLTCIGRSVHGLPRSRAYGSMCRYVAADYMDRRTQHHHWRHCRHRRSRPQPWAYMEHWNKDVNQLGNNLQAN